MKLSEFFAKVQRLYVPGVIQHYGKMKDDPWQASHDKIENALLTQDQSIIESAAYTASVELDRLIKYYKSVTASAVVIPNPMEAFFSNGLVDYFENKNQECRECGSRDSLSVVSTGVKATDYKIVCHNHKGVN